MAEVIRVRWAAAKSGDHAAGATDIDTGISTVGVVDLARDLAQGDSGLSLVLVALVDSDLDMGLDLVLGLDRWLERLSGIWHDDLVLAPAALALVALVDSVALGLGRVCLVEAISSMSCWTSCKSGQSMGMR